MSIYAEKLREYFNHDLTDQAADEIDSLEDTVSNLKSEIEKLKERVRELEEELDSLYESEYGSYHYTLTYSKDF